MRPLMPRGVDEVQIDRPRFEQSSASFLNSGEVRAIAEGHGKHQAAFHLYRPVILENGLKDRRGPQTLSD
jgi:hypothetical protein